LAGGTPGGNGAAGASGSNGALVVMWVE
jgi:hypothetical protein